MGNQIQAEQVTQGQPVNKYDSFKNSLTAQKQKIEKVLPAHIKFEKFQSVVITACMQNEDLLTADRTSMMLSCVKSATDGLLPDGREAALVIFNSKHNGGWIKKVQYMPMYAGILKKVRQSEELASIDCNIVYERDEFEYALGDDNAITHKPYLGKEDRGEIIAAYAIAKLKDGTIMREVMSVADIEKVRKTSKSGNDKDGNPKGIWASWYEEMAKKTVFRRLAKWLPQSIDKDGNEIRVFDNDDSMEIIDQYDEQPGVEPEQPKLTEVVNEKREEEAKPEVEEKVTEDGEVLPADDQKPADPETPAEEKKKMSALEIDDTIRKAVNAATDKSDLLEILSGEFDPLLAQLKEENAVTYERLNNVIQAKLKELDGGA